MGDVDDVQAVLRRHERVAELHLHGDGVGDRDRRDDARLQRLLHVEHDHAVRRRDVEPRAGHVDVRRAGEHATLVPGHRAREEVVARFLVREDVDVGRDQAFHRIRDVRVAVDLVHRLLEVLALHQRGRLLAAVVAVDGDRLRGTDGHARGVRALDARVLAQRRERRRDDALGEALVADARDVVRAHALVAFRDVQVLAAQLDAVRHAGAVAIRLVELATVFLVLLVVVRVRVALQVAADDGLRLVELGHAHGVDLAFAADPRVVPDEVDELRTEQQQLGHDRVVVVRLRQVAVGAGLRFGPALRVRVVRGERLRRVAGRRDRRLLDVDALAVHVLRGQHQRRRRADRRDLVVLDHAVLAEEIHVVARDLRVVRRVVAREAAFVTMALGTPVRLDRQVAAAAAGGPRAVAGVADHRVFAVRAVLLRDVLAPREVLRVLRHRMRARRLRVVRGRKRVGSVLHQRHRPLQAGRRRRALDQARAAVHPLESALAVRVADQLQVQAALRSGGTGRLQDRIVVDRAVAVLALDLDRAHDLGLDVAVAVAVLREVAVDALHAQVDVHRREVHGLLELLRVVVGDHLAVRVEQVALAVAREDRAEVPAVAVVVGELDVLELRVELGDVLRELRIAPLAADRRFFRVAVEDVAELVGIVVELLLGPHRRGVGLVVPHRVAEHRVDEHVRLVHVADHALRGRDLTRERVLDRMARFVARDRRVGLRRHAFIAVLRPDGRVARVAVVRVDHVAARAARRAIVARVVVRAHEPQERIVEARLVHVQHGDRHAQAGAGAAVRLAQVGTARLFQALQLAELVRVADLGEDLAEVAAAALEHAEHVGRRYRLPGRHRRDLRQDAVLLHVLVELDGNGQRAGLGLLRVRLAQDRMLVGQDAVVVRRRAPEHRGVRHQAALARLDDRQVARAACLARDAQVARVHEADELLRLLVQPGIAVLRVRAGGPARGVTRQHVCRVDRGLVGGLVLAAAFLLAVFPAFLMAARVAVVRGDRRGGDARRRHHVGVAAVAVGAAQHHGGRGVHRLAVAARMAAHAAGALGVGGFPALRRGCVRCLHVLALDGFGFLARARRQRGEREEGDGGAGEPAQAARRGGIVATDLTCHVAPSVGQDEIGEHRVIR